MLSGLVLLMLVATVIFSLPHVEAEAFTPFAPQGWTAVGTAGVLIFWAFFGWESITHLVPEFKHPERDVMRSTWMSVLLVGLVYISLAFVTIGTGMYGGASNDAPLALLMQQALGVGAGIATAVVACIVCVGTMNVFFASSSRMGYALARDGVLPSFLQATSKRGVPHRSLLLLYGTNAVTMGVCYLFAVSMDQVMLVPVTLGILVYIIATLACVKLLWDDKIGRFSSILSALFCLAVAPFAEGFLFVPVVVTAACLLYLRLKKGKVNKEISAS
ncbi:APC family permease [Tumebacillus avium]|uniref:APC family permease n=1 Tax=Tumebacillus avium TaxID=1903704 RepID=UPI0018DFDA5A|nr:amino acid permease [Tumebacillus avium]